VITITEITVGFRELGFGCDDALAGEQEHGFNVFFGEAGFWHNRRCWMPESRRQSGM
jgi:hypothetical protein